MKRVITGFANSLLLLAFIPIATVWAEKADTMHVTQAIYGDFAIPKDTCDATVKVQSLCDGLTLCEVPVTDSTLCGYDPAPGLPKAVIINYTCGTLGYATTAPEGSAAILNCNQNNLNHEHVSVIQKQNRVIRWYLVRISIRVSKNAIRCQECV